MMKKPYNGKAFFELIKNMLVEKQQLPVILDYGIGSMNAERIELRSSEFDIRMDIDFGGSEGIYVSIYIDGCIGEAEGRYNIGTFKTLHESEEAFRTMALLGANFILAAREYVRKNMLDFEWTGFYLTANPKKEDSPKLNVIKLI